MEVEAVGADVVRPLRRAVLRPACIGDRLVFPGDDEPETLHCAVRIDGSVVAVATVMPDPHPHDPEPGDWRIRGMATSPALRNRGIGAAMLAACEAHASDHGAGRLWCNARVDARAFYERGGLIVEGNVFEIPGVGPHYLMSKPLPERSRNRAGDPR